MKKTYDKIVSKLKDRKMHHQRSASSSSDLIRGSVARSFTSNPTVQVEDALQPSGSSPSVAKLHLRTPAARAGAMPSPATEQLHSLRPILKNASPRPQNPTRAAARLLADTPLLLCSKPTLPQPILMLKRQLTVPVATTVCSVSGRVPTNLPLTADQLATVRAVHKQLLQTTAERANLKRWARSRARSTRIIHQIPLYLRAYFLLFGWAVVTALYHVLVIVVQLVFQLFAVFAKWE